MILKKNSKVIIYIVTIIIIKYSTKTCFRFFVLNLKEKKRYISGIYTHKKIITRNENEEKKFVK